MVMNVMVSISMYGLFKTIIHDGFDTYHSTARSWATIVVIVSIVANTAFLTLIYNLIQIFITSKDVLDENNE